MQGQSFSERPVVAGNSLKGVSNIKDIEMLAGIVFLAIRNPAQIRKPSCLVDLAWFLIVKISKVEAECRNRHGIRIQVNSPNLIALNAR